MRNRVQRWIAMAETSEQAKAEVQQHAYDGWASVEATKVWLETVVLVGLVRLRYPASTQEVTS